MTRMTRIEEIRKNLIRVICVKEFKQSIQNTESQITRMTRIEGIRRNLIRLIFVKKLLKKK